MVAFFLGAVYITLNPPCPLRPAKVNMLPYGILSRWQSDPWSSSELRCSFLYASSALHCCAARVLCCVKYAYRHCYRLAVYLLPGTVSRLQPQELPGSLDRHPPEMCCSVPDDNRDAVCEHCPGDGIVRPLSDPDCTRRRGLSWFSVKVPCRLASMLTLRSLPHRISKVRRCPSSVVDKRRVEYVVDGIVDYPSTNRPCRVRMSRISVG